jgi:2-oxoglutarate/2-oxoacid ferredoxin oxidoreductase subunit alpha
MHKSISIVLSGEAGQGLQIVEEFLVESLARETFVFSSKEVMSRVRGGNNTAEIRISAQPIDALRYTIDALFLFNNHALDRLRPRLTNDSVLYGEADFITEEDKKHLKFVEVPLTELAKQAGNKLFINTVLFGYIAGMLDIETKNCVELITSRFAKLGEETVGGNLKAFDLGYALSNQDTLKPVREKPLNFVPRKVFTGNHALLIGALAGGVDYLAAYPMSPGTSVMSMLSEKSHAFGVLVEQAEDEIAAINMVQGAWYAGARAMTTTSGGGFALMSEGISLAGMTETPAVIHVAGRPGPATGLPTRTEQADLNLVVFAGHGEFPRVVYAPATIEDGVELAARAFWMADKYQIPVFLLSDQYWLESMVAAAPTIPQNYLERFIAKTTRDYKRYAFDPSGISPRGIPGFGEGFVKVDSDEHDEYGAITESFEMRVKMHEKRLGKFGLMRKDEVEPRTYGKADAKHLLIGWGSTYGVLREYVDGHDDTRLIQLRQVYPLPASLESRIAGAASIIVVENNASGQLANLMQMKFGRKFQQRILKYSGEPFFIEEIQRRIQEVSA